MSVWGRLEATFNGSAVVVEQIEDGLPTGSEGGPSVVEEPSGLVVSGRLRDVSDFVTSPQVLAWFTRACETAIVEHAELLWEIADDGPRYRYMWSRAGGLAKRTGILEL